MTAIPICPQCGCELPAEAPAGLCPGCLLRQGLENEGGSDSTLAHAPTLAPRTSPTGGPAPGIKLRYFGDYEILQEIARGGMGVVYKARQVSLDRTVALKMILAGQLASDSDIERFYTEARAAANLQHSNIVAIHEVGRHEGQHYFSMDFVDGTSLAALVKTGPLPVSKAVAYLKSIAEAIDYAHRRGILHRDLKPSNILIDGFDQPRITDFGIAKRIGTKEVVAAGPAGRDTPLSLTAPGDVLGTPSYMSPEQIDGDPTQLGPASDVYSLGAVLYELLTGRPPFCAGSLRETLVKVLQAQPVPPRRLNRRVPWELEQICLKCLRKEPRERYSSAGDLAADLERFSLGQPTRAAGEQASTRFVKFALGCASAVLLCCGGLFFLGRNVIRYGISQYQRESAIQQQYQSLAASWHAPAEADSPDVLFPKRVGDFKRVAEAQAGGVTIPEIGIDLPGRRARYESPRSAVEFFLFRVRETACDSLLERVERALEGRAGYRHFSIRETNLKRFGYALSTPNEKGTFLWAAGWLLFARTADGYEPDDFLTAYLEAGGHK